MHLKKSYVQRIAIAQRKTHSRKILSLLLAFAMLFTLVPAIGPTASADTGGRSFDKPEPWEGTADINWYDASIDDFAIYTAEELAGLAELVNSGRDTFSGKTVTLMVDLDLNGEQWTPIGFDKKFPFQGSFDGNGCEVTGLQIGEMNSFSTDYNYNGLFGYLGSASKINSLSVAGELYLGIAYSNGKYNGGLAGYNEGRITDCYSMCNITSGAHNSNNGGLTGYNDSYITSSYAAGSVISNGNYSCTGGLTGYNSIIYGGYITGSCAMGNVINSGDFGYAGGLMGVNMGGYIRNSYATGDVTDTGAGYDTGGLAAYSTGDIVNSCAIGDVSGNGNVGGLAGWLSGYTTNSYATGDVTGGTNVGGLVGQRSGSGRIINSYAAGIVDGATNVGGLIGDSDTRDADVAVTKGYYNESDNPMGVGSITVTTDIEGKSLVEMQTEDFADSLNEYAAENRADRNGTTLRQWAQSSSRNEGVPELAVTIMPDENQGKVYGENSPEITFSNDGYLQDSSLSGSLAYAGDEDAGTYSIILGTLAAKDGTPLAVSLSAVMFTIYPKSDAIFDIAAIPNQTRTGSAIEPKPMVFVEGALLREGVDFNYSYADNINVGTAAVFITGAGNYLGSTGSATFVISSGGGSSGGGSTGYTVTFSSNGGSSVNSQRVNYNGTATVPESPAREGYTFTGWYTDAELTTKYNFTDKVTKSFTLYAGWERTGEEPGPVDYGHPAYIQGYGDGTFRPNNTLTRAEAATLFYNLLDSSVAAGSYVPDFSDVASGTWYYNAVMELARRGIINGYPDGTFKPGETITRAEFVTMALRFADHPANNGVSGFPDVSENYWAAGSIGTAAAEGYITGYPDGTFQPNETVSRGEAVTVLNNIIGCDGLSSGASFSDVPGSHWAFNAITGAATGHNHD